MFKIFDGSKVSEIIENKSVSTTTRKPKRKHNNERTLAIEYVNDTLLQPSTIQRTKTTSKIYQNSLKENNMDKLTITTTNNNELQLKSGKTNLIIPFSSIYDLSTMNHEQLNTLSIVALYYNSSNQSTNNERVLTIKQIKNLQKILGVNVEIYTNAFDRVLDKFYSTNHIVDKLIGSIDDATKIIDSLTPINDGIIIDKPKLSKQDLLYINSRMNSLYSTVVITKTEIDDIQTFYELNNDYKCYIIYPSYVSSEDRNILINYIDDTMQENVVDTFKVYTHPKFSSCEFVPRMIFNLEFLNLLYESFKLSDIVNPLTQNEIATYIAANRQFMSISTVEQYLNAYTIITAERI